MNRRETPRGAPPADTVGATIQRAQSTPGRSDPPVKPTSEVAHQPGQQPAASNWCNATDGLGLRDDPLCADEPFGRCNLPAGHNGDWHQEWRGDELWAKWRGPHPGQRCNICGKDGSEH